MGRWMHDRTGEAGCHRCMDLSNNGASASVENSTGASFVSGPHEMGAQFVGFQVDRADEHVEKARIRVVVEANGQP